MLSRTRTCAAGLVGVLALVACSSESEPQPITGDSEGQTSESSDGDDRPEEDKSVEDEPDEPSVFDGQLYPPLPEEDLEPDPNLPLDEEQQRRFLDLHAEAYDVFQTAVVTNDVDEEELLRYASEDEVGAFVEFIEVNRERGVVNLSPDGEIRWVQVINATDEEASIGECVVSGSRTGNYDADSGEPVELVDETRAYIRVTEYRPVADGDQRFRQTAITTQENNDACSS